jgi:hypothetical protein
MAATVGERGGGVAFSWRGRVLQSLFYKRRFVQKAVLREKLGPKITQTLRNWTPLSIIKKTENPFR